MASKSDDKLAEIPRLLYDSSTNKTYKRMRFLGKNKLKSAPRDRGKKFISLTLTGERTVIYCLQQNDWKLDLASDIYFQNPDYYYRQLDRKQLFLRYRDPSDSQKITSKGVIRFLDDLELSPDSKLALIIAWKFHGELQCELTREKFVNGLRELGIDSLPQVAVAKWS